MIIVGLFVLFQFVPKKTLLQFSAFVWVLSVFIENKFDRNKLDKGKMSFMTVPNRMCVCVSVSVCAYVCVCVLRELIFHPFLPKEGMRYSSLI